MFGTMPSCLFTASSSGRDFSGASSMEAGVGMRDMAWFLSAVRSLIGR
jgi:hypothetical protein